MMTILSGLSKDQVLQRLGSRGANVSLTGTAGADGSLVVTITGPKGPLKGWKKKAVGKVARGRFKAELAGIPAGGPYGLKLVCGRESATITPFFVGDVWILAGQSNMQGIGKAAGAAKPHPLVRAFSMRREWRLATDPLHVLEESPDKCHTLAQCSPEAGERLRRNSLAGVGVGIFFAREMIERSGGVPQGLICAAHGGTSMQQWDPARKKLGGESLYASMLMSAQATGQPVAGVLWYQGESDNNITDMPLYTGRMKKLVAATRRDLRQPKLPWIIAQIGRVCAQIVSPIPWNGIQEQQRLLPGKIPFFETVPTIDLGLDDNIHISSAAFPQLAMRMASAADRLVYGNRHESRPPQFRRARKADQPPQFAVEVEFDHVIGGLQSAGEPHGFAFVSNEEKDLESIYKTELLGTKVRLHIGRPLAAGTRLFYGYGFTPVCNITDARGFSLPMFGPVLFGPPVSKALAPFVPTWRVTGVVDEKRRLDRIPLPDLDALGATTKTYGADGFINERPQWQGKTGQAYFQSSLQLSEPMQLEFLMGYDGPFRLWLNGKPFFTNIKGTNPCMADESAKTVALPAGTHDIRVGMDLNDGRAWGFFLRFARKDVTQEQIASGDFVKPAYSAGAASA